MPSSDSIPKTDHLFTSVFLPQGWEGLEWPMAGAFVFLIIVNFFSVTITACIKSWCPAFIDNDINIDEDICNYWESLDENDRKWSLKEEENSRVLKMSVLTDD